jgi:2-dehydropantoate 2-reductase
VANPLTAILGVRNDDIITPELAETRRAVVEEIRLVAREAGVELPEGLSDRVDEWLSRSHNRNSMLQDVACGRPTEIEELNGLIARRARAAGRRAPANETLLRLVRFMELRRDARRGPAGERSNRGRRS